jgi:hypothetical protein
MHKLALATCSGARDLDQDGPLLRGIFSNHGVIAEPVVWDDPDVDWDSYDIVMIRSTWDYTSRREEFLKWASQRRVLANPYRAVAWNTDKQYLSDLYRAGVPSIPTQYVPPGWKMSPPAGRFVIKPSIGGGAQGTGCFDHPNDTAANQLLAQLHAAGRTAIVQPYVDAIDTHGETSIIFLGGSYSHAVRREPLLTRCGIHGGASVVDVLATTHEIRPSSAQLEVARKALMHIPGTGLDMTYARVDLLPGPTGPLLLELEITDCFLFLSFAAESAVGQMVRHLMTKLPAEW